MSTNEGSRNASSRALRYAPLAFSWLLMNVDAQFVMAAVARRPNSTQNMASIFILIAVVQFVSSPITDLTTTATTLANNRAHFGEVRRFALAIVGLVTLAHAAIAFTPLYWLMTERVIGTSHATAMAGRGALMLTVPWCGCVGWRRFCQGVLIRTGQTHFVGLGTAVRICITLPTLYVIYSFTAMSGVVLGASVMMLSIAVETTFANSMMREALNRDLLEDVDGPPIGFKKLLAFQFPLFVSTLIAFSVPTIVAAALSRLPDADVELAGFSTGSAFLLLVSSFTFALPEFLIAQLKEMGRQPGLGRFAAAAAMAACAILLGLSIGGVDLAYFATISHVTPTVAGAAHLVVLTGCTVPLWLGWQGYLRAQVTATDQTVPRLVAVIVSIGVLFLLMSFSHWPFRGAIAASVGTSMSFAAECACLYFLLRLQNSKRASESPVSG